VRLLFLSPIGGVGGAERVLLTAVAGVRRTDPSAVVGVLTLTDGPLVAAVRDLGAEADVVPMPTALSRLGDSARETRLSPAKLVALAPAGIRFVTRLRAAVRRFAPDLVHSNGIKTHLLTRVAVPRGVPVVWHLHDFYGLRPVAARLLRRAAGRARAGIAISRAVAADTATVLPGLPVHVLPNAVDLTRYSPGPGDDLDVLAGFPPAVPGTIRVGLVATYARWKGHLTFLDAAARLAASDPDLPVRQAETPAAAG
jgi:glycosyltransferase involved in cell wall biosynthesis